MTTARLGAWRSYGDTSLAAMMHAVIDEVVSARFELMKFAICLCQTIDDIVSWPRYLVQVAEALLDPKEFLGHVTHEVKTEAYRVIQVSSNRKVWIKHFPGLSKWWYLFVLHHRVSLCQRTSAMTKLTKGPNPLRIRRRRAWKKENRRPRSCTKEKRKSKKSKAAYKSGKSIMLKVTEPMHNLFKEAVIYRTYHFLSSRRDSKTMWRLDSTAWWKWQPFKWRTGRSPERTACQYLPLYRYSRQPVLHAEFMTGPKCRCSNIISPDASKHPFIPEAHGQITSILGVNIPCKCSPRWFSSPKTLCNWWKYRQLGQRRMIQRRGKLAKHYSSSNYDLRYLGADPSTIRRHWSRCSSTVQRHLIW